MPNQVIGAALPIEFRAFFLYVRLRPIVFLATLAATGALALSGTSTVSNIQGDPSLPRIRLCLLLAGVTTSLFTLFVRPVLPEAERLTTLRIRSLRLSLLIGTLAAIAGLESTVGIVTGNLDASSRAIVVAFALMGVAQLAALIGTFWGLLVPWLYLVSGLAFGYVASAGGPASAVHPWAWLIDPKASPSSILAVGSTALMLGAMVRPRSDPA